MGQTGKSSLRFWFIDPKTDPKTLLGEISQIRKKSIEPQACKAKTLDKVEC